MYNSAKQLLGQWMVELVATYFFEQKKTNADKLFIKIVGVADDTWEDILQAFAKEEGKLSTYYRPVLRTLAPVPAYEKYQCQAHETSTWLRNNTQQGHALLILLNASSAEAQSLENIFTIDEARLLSPNGLEVLYQIFSDRYQYFGDDLDQLKRFLTMYGRIVEPQLRTVLAFLTAVVSSSERTMTDRIQQSLDHLQLFRDRTLKFTGTGLKQLRDNYQLSRLEKDNRSIGKEKIVDNLYTFLEKNESHELWELVSKDVFRNHALNYIHGKSEQLFEYDYSLIKDAFMFTDKKPTVNERINTFKEGLETDSPLAKEQDDIITGAVESINAGDKPEKLQEFLEEFGGQLLVGDKKLYKEIERLIKKLRQLSEYTELTEALLQESIDLLKEQCDDDSDVVPLSAVRFELRIMEAPVGEDMKSTLMFHLGSLERLTGRIHFDDQSLQRITNRSRDAYVGFRLVMLLGDRELGHRDFKLIGLHESKLPDLLEKLEEERFVPAIRVYAGSDTLQVDVIAEMHDRVSAFVATGQPGVPEVVAEVTFFIEWFIKQLDRARAQGIGSVDFSELESRLDGLFKRGCGSALIARHVIQYIGMMGTIDCYSNKSTDKVANVQSRILTLLNPLRLLGYANRLRSIEAELSKWIGRSDLNEESLEDMNVYLGQLSEDLSRLFPSYFAVEGVSDHFLIEQQESMGEGIFTINGASSGEDQLVKMFADELLGTVKSYLEVYPYAKDCLDLVFLYCPQAAFITRAISLLFQQTNVQKIKAIIHSSNAGAVIHEQLNAWMSQEEQLSERMGHFPRVEVQVVAEQDVNVTMRHLSQLLQDADIGVLVNYFGQSSHLQYKLEKVRVKDSDNWFEKIYREPLKKDDAIKRISCISEQMPSILQRFYQVQQVLNSNESVQLDEHFLLRTVISVNQLSDQALLNYMHEHFNWSLFIDRYLDKPLLRHVSSKAQIIKYKSNTYQTSYKTLLSSSKYIRKLASEQADHEYFDRLHQKYVQLLKNNNISKTAISQATEKVKEISGGVVLRAIGPGKFAHELMAIHLAMEARPVGDNELVIWSICDELPWFRGSSRRPDLVRTSISKIADRVTLKFEIVELKFISATIFEQERHDAIKQVNAGINVYRSRFLFSERPTTAEMWRKELLNNLIENGTYTLEDAQLLKMVQGVPLSNIDVSIDGSIDTFVYTSNLLELSIMDGHQDGYQSEKLGNALINHIYNRSFILRALGAMVEAEVPNYEVGIQAMDAYITEKLGFEFDKESYMPDDEEHDEKSQELTDVGGSNFSAVDHIQSQMIARKEIIHSLQKAAPTTDINPFSKQESASQVNELFTEQLAFAELPSQTAEQREDLAPLLRSYESRLRLRMNEINVPLKIVDTIVGVSVIRVIIELIGNTSYSHIKNRSEDLQMWLGLNSPPQIAIRAGKVNIDINRDTPEVVYFERFMARVREQISQDNLNGKLIAPLGVGQLGEIITMDFSSPDTPHLLIGGQSGSGKSVTINGIILAMMCLYSSNDVKFIFIDPKRVEFMVYKEREHTQLVITDIEEAIDALDQVVIEMEKRYERFAQEGATNYNEYMELEGEPLPRLVVVFDEFADFMTQEKSLSSRVETAIKRLGAMARAAGIHLLICTQSPRADIVPTNIRNNLGARLALRTADANASRIVLDEDGAEQLGGKGDFLAKLNGPEFVRGKSPFLTIRAKKALLEHFHVKEKAQQ